MDKEQMVMYGGALGGFVFGSAFVSLFCPIERAQVILQTQRLNIQVQNLKFPIYKDAWDFFKRMFRVESPTLMWRGNTILIAQLLIPLISKSPAILTLQKIKTSVLDEPDDSIELKDLLPLSLYFLTYPIDLVRVRRIQGLFDCAKQIQSIDGYKGFFRGIIPHIMHHGVLLSTITGSGYYFATHLDKDHVIQLVASGIIFVSSGFLAYPFGTLQRQMIMQSGIFFNISQVVKNYYIKGLVIVLDKCTLPEEQDNFIVGY